MNTDAVAAIASTPPAATGSGALPTGNALASDFETFLKMLTAQARYQDPLEPLDSTEYAAQLAQFSMVEQQVQTNATLATLAAHLGGQNAMVLSAWVGMDVRAVMPAGFDGSPVTVVPAVAAGADRAMLVVRDETGREVQRQTIPLDGAPIEWAGVDGAKGPFPSGTYKFDVESFFKGELIETKQAAVYQRIVEAQLRPDGVDLITADGHLVDSADVTAMRAAARG